MVAIAAINTTASVSASRSEASARALSSSGGPWPPSMAVESSSMRSASVLRPLRRTRAACCVLDGIDELVPVTDGEISEAIVLLLECASSSSKAPAQSEWPRCSPDARA